MNHDYYMNIAYKEAQNALEIGEIPVGAVVVAHNQMIAKAHNQVEKLQDVTAHAEILAITSASNYLGSKYLKDCTLYVTLEPCLMCAGAISWSQLDTLVYGASDSKKGFFRFQDIPSPPIPSKTQIISGIQETKCQEILFQFFRNLRKLN